MDGPPDDEPPAPPPDDDMPPLDVPDVPAPDVPALPDVPPGCDIVLPVEPAPPMLPPDMPPDDMPPPDDIDPDALVEPEPLERDPRDRDVLRLLLDVPVELWPIDDWPDDIWLPVPAPVCPAVADEVPMLVVAPVEPPDAALPEPPACATNATGTSATIAAAV